MRSAAWSRDRAKPRRTSSASSRRRAATSGLLLSFSEAILQRLVYAFEGVSVLLDWTVVEFGECLQGGVNVGVAHRLERCRHVVLVVTITGFVHVPRSRSAHHTLRGWPSFLGPPTTLARHVAAHVDNGIPAHHPTIASASATPSIGFSSPDGLAAQTAAQIARRPSMRAWTSTDHGSADTSAGTPSAPAATSDRVTPTVPPCTVARHLPYSGVAIVI